MTLETFTSCMSLLQGIFGQLEDTKLKIYHTVLSSMSDSDFETATKRLIKTFKPTSTVQFPVPANFTEAIGNTSTVHAQEYMAMVQKAVYSVGSYRSVDFGCPALHSVIERFGGWCEICKWTQDQWNLNEGRFLKALEIAIEYGDRGSDYLRGIIETTNGDVKHAQLSHVYKSQSGKIMIASGLHPATKLLPAYKNNDVDKIINELAENMSLVKTGA